MVEGIPAPLGGPGDASLLGTSIMLLGGLGMMAVSVRRRPFNYRLVTALVGLGMILGLFIMTFDPALTSDPVITNAPANLLLIVGAWAVAVVVLYFFLRAFSKFYERDGH